MPNGSETRMPVSGAAAAWSVASVMAAASRWAEQAADGWRIVSGVVDDPESSVSLVIEIGRAGVRLSGPDGEVAFFATGADALGALAGLPAAIRSAIGETGERMFALGVADDLCIDLDLVLPHAPLSVLERVAATRAGAEQPYAHGEGLAFWHISREQPDGAHLRLVFVPAEPIRAVLDALATAGLAPVAVRRIGSRPFSTRASWLSSSANMQASVLWTRGPIARPFWIAAMAFAIVAGSLCANIAVSAVNLWSAAEDASTAGADSELIRRDEVQRRYLAARQAESVARLRVMDELAAKLPDGTWLAQSDILGDRIEIIGFAASAAETLRQVAAVPYLRGVENLSAVTRDDGSRVERFRLGGQIVVGRSSPNSSGRSP